MLKPKKVSRITTTALLIVLVSLPIAAFQIPSVSAHEDEHVHKHMSEEAWNLLEACSPGSAMSSEISLGLERIKDGSYYEDHHDHVYGIDIYGIMSIPHYWDADLGPDDGVKDIWGTPDQYPNAYQKACALFAMALEDYSENPPDLWEAYERLGHAAHLVEDQTVPCHVHEDFHPSIPGDITGGGDDCFEKWMASSEGYLNYGAASARAQGGLITFPENVKARMRNGDWQAGLYYLMYTTNQYADYFASDDVNGDTDDPERWMDYSGWPSSPSRKSDLEDNDWYWDYTPCAFGLPPIPRDYNNNEDGDLGNIARYSFNYGIRAVATLYKMFYELTHPPQATIEILATDANHDDAADYRYIRLDLTYDVGADEFFGDLEARFCNDNPSDPQAWTDWMSAGAVPGGRRASWILSEGDDTKTVDMKTVYYQVRNLMGANTTVSDSIPLKTIGMPQTFHYEFSATGTQSLSALVYFGVDNIHCEKESGDGDIEFYYETQIEDGDGNVLVPYFGCPGGQGCRENPLSIGAGQTTESYQRIVNSVTFDPIGEGQTVRLRIRAYDSDVGGDDYLGPVLTSTHTIPTTPGASWDLIALETGRDDNFFTYNPDTTGSNEYYSMDISIWAEVSETPWSGYEVPPYPMNPTWVAYGAPEEKVASSNLKAPYPYEYTTKWQPEQITNPAIVYRMVGSDLYAYTTGSEPSMTMFVLSPVDFNITDPAGNKISSHKRYGVKQWGIDYWWELECNVPGASIIREIDWDRDGKNPDPIDLDGDGVTDTLIVFDERGIGDYQVQVSPSIGADPSETYSIGVSSSALLHKAGFLSQDVRLADIQAQPLIMKSTATTLNLPPNADANGPYNATEGTPISFNATSSTDPEGDLLTYRWDFENDETWDTAWSSTPTASHTWTDEWTGTAKVEVSDGNSADTSIAIVTVANAPPTVNAGPNQLAAIGDEVHFSGSFTDAGGTDTYAIVWDFGDGTPGAGTLTPTHVYSGAKKYNVTLNVTDDHGDTGRDTLTVNTGVEVSIEPLHAVVPPGDDTTYNVKIHHLGKTTDTYNLNLYGLDPAWYSLQTQSGTLNPGQSETVALTVFPPNTAAIQAYGFTIAASSQTDPYICDKADADAFVATAHDLHLEEVPPVTNLVIGQPKYFDSLDSKIYVTSATPFTFIAEDNIGGIGVASTFYHILNATHDTGRLEYTAPFCLTGLSDGQYSIVYYSKDNVANKEVPKSEQVTLDNAPPTITMVVNPVSINTPVTLTATVDDSRTGGCRIASAQYSVDGGNWISMNAVDACFDEVTEDVTATLNPIPTPDVLDITVRGTDALGNQYQVSTLLAVYDPSAGFVTGAGWINSPLGAYSADPTLTGKATFGFVSKYQKGATLPTGQTEFQFHAGNLDFHSTTYQWLVVAGSRAQFKGSGIIKGSTGEYGFILTAIDGQINGGGGIDKFRIKIWDKATGIIIYDNQMNLADTANPTTAIAGGSIVIHA